MIVQKVVLELSRAEMTRGNVKGVNHQMATHYEISNSLKIPVHCNSVK